MPKETVELQIELSELIKLVRQAHAPADCLEAIAHAAKVADDLNNTGDRLVDHFVAEGRSAGYSWSQIGNALGVSKQAAQQRFRPRKLWPFGGGGRRESSGLFGGRFSSAARQVVVRAQKEARDLKHNYIGTEHLLLALANQATDASKALGEFGVTPLDVRAKIVEIIGEGDEAPTGHIKFTPRSKKALELSLREALRLGHKSIEAEHILLGLIREGEGVACQILHELKADPDDVRGRVENALASRLEPREES
jgi:hypothetical protein